MSVDSGPDADTRADDPSATIQYRYPGSPPFRDSELDRSLFRGRSEEADTVLHSILSSDLFLLYAVSGLGKTSLLNAGVVHELRARGHWPVSVRLNDTTMAPVVEIREQLEDAADADPDIDLQRDPNFEGVLGPDPSLWDLLASLEVWRGNQLQRLVVILDQFEELFTLGWDDAVRQRFIIEFGEVVRGHRLHSGAAANGVGTPQDVKFVLVTREDALGELEALATDIPQIMRNRFRLGPLDLENAEAAIREPALVEDGRLDSQRFGYTEAAAREILDFLRTKTERDTVVRSDTVDPSQLQIVCQYVERAILPSKGVPLPGQILEIDEGDLGGRRGLDRILGDFYRRTIQSFDGSQQKAVRQLCERGLINPAGRRLSLEEGEIRDAFDVSPVMLHRLVDERLLRADPRVGSVYYELAHDTLVGPILAFGDEQRRLRSRRRRGWIAIAGAAAALAVVSLLAYVAISDTAGDDVAAERLPVGETLTGSIGEAGADVRFSIVPAEEQTLLVTVSPIVEGDGSAQDADREEDGDELNVVVELTNAAGARRQQDQLPTGQPEHMVVPPASDGEGSREVRVTSFDSTTGSFEISLDELTVTDLSAESLEFGSIAEPGDLSVFRAEAGGSVPIAIDVRARETSGSSQPSEQDSGDGQDAKQPQGIDIEVEVVDPAGVGNRIDSGGADEPERVLLGAVDGQHLVIVRGYQFGTGEFQVEAKEQVSALTAGLQATGEIGSPTATAEFTFDLPGEGSYAVVTVEADELFDPVLDIVDPGGELQTVDNGGDGTTEMALIGDAEGRYILNVRGFESSTGQFQISANQQASQTLTAGEPERGEIESGTEVAAFVVDLPGGGSFLDVAVGADEQFDPVLNIVDPSGELRTVDNGGVGTTEIGIIRGAEGRYVVVVSGWESSTGGFDIVTHPFDIQPLEPGGSVTVSGPIAFDVDVPSGEALAFTASPVPSDGSLTIQVDDPDGFAVDGTSSTDGDPATVFVTSDLASSYQVLVSSGGTGEYTATLSELAVLALGLDDTVTVTEPTAFDVEVPAGEVLEFTADPQSSAASMIIQVNDPDGFPFDFAFSTDGDAATVVLDDSVAGAYQVLVSSSGGPGEYTASFTRR